MKYGFTDGTINDVIFEINQIVCQKENFQSLKNLDVFLLLQKIYATHWYKNLLVSCFLIQGYVLSNANKRIRLVKRWY